MVTVSTLIDYLNQFPPDMEVVLADEDADEENEGNYVSLTSLFLATEEEDE